MKRTTTCPACYRTLRRTIKSYENKPETEFKKFSKEEVLKALYKTKQWFLKIPDEEDLSVGDFEVLEAHNINFLGEPDSYEEEIIVDTDDYATTIIYEGYCRVCGFQKNLIITNNHFDDEEIYNEEEGF